MLYRRIYRELLASQCLFFLSIRYFLCHFLHSTDFFKFYRDFSILFSFSITLNTFFCWFIIMQWIRDEQLPVQNEPLNREHVSTIQTFIQFTRTGWNNRYVTSIILWIVSFVNFINDKCRGCVKNVSSQMSTTDKSLSVKTCLEPLSTKSVLNHVCVIPYRILQSFLHHFGMSLKKHLSSETHCYRISSLPFGGLRFHYIVSYIRTEQQFILNYLEQLLNYLACMRRIAN